MEFQIVLSLQAILQLLHGPAITALQAQFFPCQAKCSTKPSTRVFPCQVRLNRHPELTTQIVRASMSECRAIRRVSRRLLSPLSAQFGFSISRLWLAGNPENV